MCAVGWFDGYLLSVLVSAQPTATRRLVWIKHSSHMNRLRS